MINNLNRWHHDTLLGVCLGVVGSFAGTILCNNAAVCAGADWYLLPLVLSTVGARELLDFYDTYGVDRIVLDEHADEHTVEIDTVVLKGKTVKLYSIAAYMPDHYKLHKKFLASYYNSDTASAIFFANQLKLAGPTKMRNYYAKMLYRLGYAPTIDTPGVN